MDPTLPKRTPGDRGFSLGDALSPRGRAERWRSETGEVWRLPTADAPVAQGLLALHAQRIGGFVDGGSDDEGVWIARRLDGATLSAERRKNGAPWKWRRAVGIALDLARAVAASEREGAALGPLTPSDVHVDGSRAMVPADPWVSELVGHRTAERTGGSSTKPRALMWRPPEAADEVGWDAGSARYALGVMLYEMLSGAHPFGGAGLRHALAEALDHEAAPFADVVARTLPAGLQSFVLRLVAKDPARRPSSGADIAIALEEMLEGKLAPSTEAHRSTFDTAVLPPEHTRDDQPEAPSGTATLDLRWLWRRLQQGKLRYAPVVVGAIACAWAITHRMNAPAPPAVATVDIGPATAVDANHLGAKDCASCHPQHAAEWSQSVMGHAVKSPLFNALEALIEEQVGRDRDCPHGAGVLRRNPGGALACRDNASGLTVTGSGGEHWCVNCHSPGDNIATQMPPWQGRAGGDPRTRRPVKDLISDLATEGISCAFCHQVHGPASPNSAYQGNPNWTSFVTGSVFPSRPEDRRGLFGIANSGYNLDLRELLDVAASEDRLAVTPGGFVAHARPTPAARSYLQTSEFCGSCHDVRLFGTDVVGARKGESFKRLRNAYSEWVAYAERETRNGERPASCQDCHMSTYPGVCVSGDRNDDLIHESCPDGMRFEEREPGEQTDGHTAVGSLPGATAPHYFTSVDLPLAQNIADAALDQDGVDRHGIPLSAKKRRDLLIRRSLRFDVSEPTKVGSALHIPMEIENVGGGHKIPAGFSQEREIWVHLRVEDEAGRVLYEVGRVDRNDEDLHDKQFLRVNTNPDLLDGQGRPIGLFGADVADGPDHPEWSPPPERGGNDFRGKGLINFQNGFLRCVRCLGPIDANGECEPSRFGAHRASNLADGDYDIDTGECRSNLVGDKALFEIYFPVGALDASRGVVRGPDAIIDTRSLPPGEPKRYTFIIPHRGARGPITITARLMFRGFPPFLVKAFAEYEQRQAARGLRPSGPLVTFEMLARLERVVVAEHTRVLR